MLTKEFGDNCIVYFEGEINLNSVKTFKSDLEKVGEEFDKDIILNFNAVTYINSLGLGAVIELYKKLKLKQRTLKIVCSSPFVREIFEAVKFNKLIPLYNEDEEAI